MELYGLTSTPSNLQPDYNVCPTNTIDTVIGRELVRMRWGLIPGWWSKPLKEMRFATFNARSDTIAQKPMFRSAFKRNRCLIPVSGYYEWMEMPDGKQPYYFSRKDGLPITIAGIWDEWTDKESGKSLKSCSMVITEPNKFAAEVHDRMPVIIEQKDFEKWQVADVKELSALMKPASEKILQKWPVSRRVNSSRTDGDDPSLIEKI